MLRIGIIVISVFSKSFNELMPLFLFQLQVILRKEVTKTRDNLWFMRMKVYFQTKYNNLELVMLILTVYRFL